MVAPSTHSSAAGPDQTQLLPPRQDLALRGIICRERRAMARPKSKKLCTSTLPQHLYLESSLAMQIRLLANPTNPLRTGLSQRTVQQTPKWHQTIDQTTKSLRQPHTRCKHPARCLHELGHGRRIRSAPILVASMLENMVSRDPPSHQRSSRKPSR